MPRESERGLGLKKKVFFVMIFYREIINQRKELAWRLKN